MTDIQNEFNCCCICLDICNECPLSCCKQKIHKECLNKWFKIKMQCPLCRQEYYNGKEIIVIAVSLFIVEVIFFLIYEINQFNTLN